jgi:hypothetical protein
MSTPQDAIARVQAIALGLSGMKEAPDYPPESVNQFPFAVTYYRTGEITMEAGWMKAVYTLFCELHFARQVLPLAVAKAMPYHNTMLAALQADPTLNGTVSTVVSPVLTTFGVLEYGGPENIHIGWRFTITVKQETVI